MAGGLATDIALQQENGADPVMRGRCLAAVEAASSDLALMETTQDIICTLLQRETDTSHREQTLAAVSKFFRAIMRAPDLSEIYRLRKLRLFATEIVSVILAERPLIAEPTAPNSPAARAPTQELPARRQVDIDPAAVAAQQPKRLLAVESGRIADIVPAAMLDTSLTAADVEKPTIIHIPVPPIPEKFGSFRELFPAALGYRIGEVLRFFQRSNPDVRRGLVKPFLLSAEFERKLLTVITTIIVPRMYELSRSIGMLETSNQWNAINSRDFWAAIEDNAKTKSAIISAWNAAWADCRQRQSTKQGPDGKKVAVLVASPVLLKVRELLAPDTPDSYDLPPVRNAELELFTALLYDFDIEFLERSWVKLRQIYEQEMDRRWYQDAARTGAMRDTLLAAFDSFPERSGDFLSILCYHCMQQIDLRFLEKFTHNKGRDVADRITRLPYLMRFLAADGVDAERHKEQREKREREDAAKKAQAAAKRQG
jgi:hypothetical protein